MMPLPMPTFEQNGWSRIDITKPALDVVQQEIAGYGLVVEQIDLRTYVDAHRQFLALPDYAGDYRTYGGPMLHCLLEKSLEHFLSIVIAQPKPGQTAVDIGSCRSVVPTILRRDFGVRCYEQDLEYPSGVVGETIGSSADSIPLPDGCVDFMTLHCTFEHFEGDADTGFMRESARLLRPGGRVVILPLYLNASYCNVTGEVSPEQRERIGFDLAAQYHCVIPEWQNRFGRHYSPAALARRVIEPARAAGLRTRLIRVQCWEAIDPRLWLRWILVLERPETPL